MLLVLLQWWQPVVANLRTPRSCRWIFIHGRHRCRIMMHTLQRDLLYILVESPLWGSLQLENSEHIRLNLLHFMFLPDCGIHEGAQKTSSIPSHIAARWPTHSAVHKLVDWQEVHMRWVANWYHNEREIYLESMPDLEQEWEEHVAQMEQGCCVRLDDLILLSDEWFWQLPKNREQLELFEVPMPHSKGHHCCLPVRIMNAISIWTQPQKGHWSKTWIYLASSWAVRIFIGKSLICMPAGRFHMLRTSKAQQNNLINTLSGKMNTWESWQ